MDILAFTFVKVLCNTKGGGLLYSLRSQHLVFFYSRRCRNTGCRLGLLKLQPVAEEVHSLVQALSIKWLADRKVETVNCLAEIVLPYHSVWLYICTVGILSILIFSRNLENKLRQQRPKKTNFKVFDYTVHIKNSTLFIGVCLNKWSCYAELKWNVKSFT